MSTTLKSNSYIRNMFDLDLKIYKNTFNTHNDLSDSNHSSEFTILVVVAFLKKEEKDKDKNSLQSKHTTF